MPGQTGSQPGPGFPPHLSGQGASGAAAVAARGGAGGGGGFDESDAAKFLISLNHPNWAIAPQPAGASGGGGWRAELLPDCASSIGSDQPSPTSLLPLMPPVPGE